MKVDAGRYDARPVGGHAATFILPTPHGARMAKPALNVRSLKEQAKGREKSLKLRAAVAKMRVKVMKLDHKAARLRAKIQQYEEKADRLDQGVVPPPPRV